MGIQYHQITRIISNIVMTCMIATYAVTPSTIDHNDTFNKELECNTTVLRNVNRSFAESINDDHIEISKQQLIVDEPEQIIDEPILQESKYSDDEKYLIAKLCLAEAEGESEYGKRLVISTILNRIDSGCYPNNVYDVVYQPYQFEVMDNGRIDRVNVTDEVIALVEQELSNRSNHNVIYFRTDYYSEYGTPLFEEGAHYFSGF